MDLPASTKPEGSTGCRGFAPATPAGRVLVVDDEPLLLRSMRRILEPEGFETRLVEDPAGIDGHLHDPELDVVLLDLFLGSCNGLDVLDRVKRERPELEVVVMTGQASIESAVGCMRRGAFDYLEKPFDDVHRVRATVRKAVDRRQLVRRNLELEQELRGRDACTGLVGTAPPLRAVLRRIGSLRHNESSVLIVGESGTGKELAARALHASGPRASGPFVPVDCGALPESIIESELFGHEKGAFTGAVGAFGLFRKAHGGTLFLDEVGELPRGVQAKLLRALQQREVRPVGATWSVPVDIRVVCATNRDLETMVQTGSFRADLYYRLDVLRLEIPPLRERVADIPLLVQHFLVKHDAQRAGIVGIEDEALAELARRPWPGNVRELENTIEGAVALAHGPRLSVDDLPGVTRGAAAGGEHGNDPGSRIPLSLEAYERCALERALTESGGDATLAARRLGIGRSTFYRKLAKQGIRVRERAGCGVSAPRAIR